MTTYTASIQAIGDDGAINPIGRDVIEVSAADAATLGQKIGAALDAHRDVDCFDLTVTVHA